MTWHVDPPRVICLADDCFVELLCDHRHVDNLLGRWRCAEHDGRWRPGRTSTEHEQDPS